MSIFKLLLVGGSNLVITKGIRLQICKILENVISEKIEIHNLAVGGTGSLLGLERLMETSYENTKFNTIIVEYGINDWGTYQTDPLLWAAGFEALFQKIRLNWPHADVINVILGRRDKRFWLNQERMHEQMELIAEKYLAISINIDKILKALCDNNNFEQFYRDDAHISEPIHTHHVSSLIANQILRSSRKLSNFKVEKFLNNTSLKILPLDKNIIFKNSQFVSNCKRLVYGEKVIIRTKKVPHTISFVSTKDSGALHIKIEDMSVIINTTQAESNYKLDFVIKHTPITGLFTNENLKKIGEIDVEITVIDKSHILWNDNIVQKVWATTNPAVSLPSAFVINLSHIEAHE